MRAGLAALLVAGAALLLAASLAPSAGLASTVLRAVGGRVLSYPPLPEDLRELATRSVILDRDGNRLAIVREENRFLVALDDVPAAVRNAVLATEDQEFYEHEGVNWRAIVRAAAGNVRAGEITSGASTITQQLVKNLVLERSDRTFDRKLQEAVYAVQLEQRLSKDEILEQYLNSAYFANGVYGIGAAAEFYWGKHVSELTVADGALLAGMLRSPETNDPIDSPDQALARRAIVLEQMARVGHLAPEEAQRLAAEPLALRPRPLSDPAQDPIVSYVVEQLKGNPALGDDPDRRFRALATGGLTIRTTIDPRLQDLAERVIREHLDAGADPLAALAAVDPRSGETLAVGFGPKPFGSGPGQVDVNPAVPGLGSPGRPAGSAFKPFALVAALEGGLSPGYTIDTPSPYRARRHCQATGWQPGNYSDSGGGVMDLARATALSSNVYYAHLVDQVVGPAKLRETAERMGIRTPLGANCALVLGTDDVHMLDMASAFGTLANAGVRCEPFVVAEVVAADGRVLDRGGGRCKQVVQPAVAARATNLLEGPIRFGTASRNGQIGRPAAGKTGTTQGHKDAWFVGFVPQLSTAVWIGHELGDDPVVHPDCPRGVTGGCVPTKIWRAFMVGAVEVLSLPVEGFPAPPPVPVSSVPEVVGQPVEEAETLLDDAGFFTLADTVEHYLPAGIVVSQDPAGGASAARGSAVRLGVSDGLGAPPLMPDLRGLPADEARDRLAGLGLSLDVASEEVPADSDDVGLVVGQAPAAGTELGAGQAVTLEVGRERTAEELAPSPAPSSLPVPPGPSKSKPKPSPTPSPSPAPEPTPTGAPAGGQGGP